MSKIYAYAFVAAVASLSSAAAIAAPPPLAGKIVARFGEALSNANQINEDTWYLIKAESNGSASGPVFTMDATPTSPIQSTNLLPVLGQNADTDNNKRVLVKFVRSVSATHSSVAGQQAYRIVAAKDDMFLKALAAQNNMSNSGYVAAETGAGNFVLKAGAAANRFNIVDAASGYQFNRSRTTYHGWNTGLGYFIVTPVVVGTPVNITIVHKYNGTEAFRETKNVIAEETLAQSGVAALTRYGVTGSTTTNLNTNPTAGQVVEFNYVDNPSEALPFVPVANYTQENAGGKFYTIQVNSRYAKKVNTSRLFFDTAPQRTELHQFQFVGNPVSGFKIYNRQHSDSLLAAGAANHAIGIQTRPSQGLNYNFTDTESEFILRNHTNGAWYLLERGTDYMYINTFGGGAQAPFSAWNSSAAYGDGGSTITFKDASAEAFYAIFVNQVRDSILSDINARKAIPVLFDTNVLDQKAAAVTAKAAENPLPSSEETKNQRLAELRAIAAEVANINLDGKTFKLRNRLQTDKYMVPSLTGELVGVPATAFHHAAEPVFTLKRTADGHYLLQSKVTNLNAQSTGTQNRPITVAADEVKYRLGFVNGGTAGAFVYFAAVNPLNTSYSVLHFSNGNIVIWNHWANASHWTVEAVNTTDADYLAAAKARLAAAKGTRPSLVGTNLGQYTYTPSSEQTAADASNSVADLATIQTAVRQHNAGMGYAINQPAGRFFRIASSNNANTKSYVAGISQAGKLKQVASTDLNNNLATTVFYATTDNRLYNFADGKVMGVTDNFADAQAYNVATAVPYVFEASTSVPGAYNIKFNNTRYLYVDAAAATINAAAAPNGAAYQVKLEEVTALPITFNTGEYLTFSAPVAVTLPNGITAYTVSRINDTTPRTAQLEAITDARIPANTPVILAGTLNETYQLTIDKSNAAAPLSNNILTKVDAAEVMPETSRFFHKGDQKFVAPEAGVYKRPFVAFLDGVSAGVLEIDLDFGRLTGVENIKTVKAVAPIYDLQGRRVEKTTKGRIYVQGGKTFLQL